MTKTTSALLVLLLASPALAQSQGDTGVGGALDQVGAGYASIQLELEKQWRGDFGRYAKYGVGIAGLGAALYMAREAVYGTEGKITVRRGGSVKVGSGGGDSDDDGAVATSTTTAATTSTR